MLPVLPVLRAGASCRYRLRLGPQPTHMVTGSTRARPLRLRVRACRCYAFSLLRLVLEIDRLVQL